VTQDNLSNRLAKVFITDHINGETKKNVKVTMPRRCEHTMLKNILECIHQHYRLHMHIPHFNHN